MSASDRHDTWASGAAYDAFMGRLSRPVAREFIAWLDVTPGSRWLDVGCGTGALSQTVLDTASPEEVCGVDLSTSFVEYARENVGGPRARFEVADAQSLPFPDTSFGAVVSGLVLNFIPQPEKAVAEMARVAKPGGTVAVYVWDYAEGMQALRYFWDAVTALDPAAIELDEGRSRFSICKPEPLATLFRDAGLAEVETRPVDSVFRFRDFDEYWEPFLGGTGPAAGYAASLDEVRRDALRGRIKESIPGSSGPFELTNRAWAVRGMA